MALRRLNIKKGFRIALKKGETKVPYDRKLSLNELCELAEEFSLSDIIIGKRKLTIVPVESAEFIVRKDEIGEPSNIDLTEAKEAFDEINEEDYQELEKEDLQKEALVEPNPKNKKGRPKLKKLKKLKKFKK